MNILLDASSFWLRRDPLPRTIAANLSAALAKMALSEHRDAATVNAPEVLL